MGTKIKIEKLKSTHFNELTLLISQLGYDIVDIDEMNKVIHKDEHYCFVATSDVKVVGFIHAIKSYRLTSPPFMEIVGLVVHTNTRKKGMGKMLVRKIEELALENDLQIRVRCNTIRKEAHLFYEKMGFCLSKEQKVFKK